MDSEQLQLLLKAINITWVQYNGGHYVKSEDVYKGRYLDLMTRIYETLAKRKNELLLYG